MNIRKSASSVSSKVQKFKPSKKSLLIVAGIALLLVLFLIGTIVQVRAERQHQADVRNAATAQAARDSGKDKQISDLNAKVVKLQGEAADKLLLCNYLSTLEKAPATKGRLAKPVAAHCPQ